MTDLLAEADDALRQERLLKFWKANATYIIAIVLGVISITGGLSAYKTWDTGVKAAQTTALLALQESPDYPENITKTAKLDFRPALRGVALMNAAARYIEEKNPAKALSLYERTMKDSEISADIRDLATLMTVRLRMDQKTATGDELLALLKPVLDNPQSLWVHHAHLDAAVITAHKLKNLKGARAHLNALQDTKDLPETLYEKATALDHVYALAEAKEKQNTPKTDKTP